MIKSILDTDEENSSKTEMVKKPVSAGQTVNEETSDFDELEQEIKQIEQETDSRNIFEVPEDARFFAKPPETSVETAPTRNAVFEEETPTVEISRDNLPFVSNLSEKSEKVPDFFAPEINDFDTPTAQNVENNETPKADISQPTIFQSDYAPETPDETIRNSGMAYTAAIVLFGAIVFMMILGWFIGQLIGNPTAGIVGGIILGALIGFVQFFRITSSIFKK